MAPAAARMIDIGDVSGLQGLLESYKLSDLLPEQAVAHLALGYSAGQWFTSDPKPLDAEKLEKAIDEVSPFERIRQEWGGAFHPGNPVHDLLSLESAFVNPEETQNAYRTLTEILSLVRQLVPQASEEEKEAMIVGDALNRLGFYSSDITSGLFSRDLNRKCVGRVSRGYTILFITFEMKWALNFQRRAVDQEMIVDRGAEEMLETKQRQFVWQEIEKESIPFGVDGELDRKETLSMFINHRSASRANEVDKLGDLNRSISLDDRNAVALFNRGRLHLLKHRWHEAIEDFTQAINLLPEMARCYEGRGYAKAGLADHKGAVEDFDKALSLDPTLTLIYLDRSTSRHEIGDEEGAKADLRTVTSHLLKPVRLGHILGSSQIQFHFPSLLFSPATELEIDKAYLSSGELFERIESHARQPDTRPSTPVQELVEKARWELSLQTFLEARAPNVSVSRTMQERARILFNLGEKDEKTKT